MKISFAETLVHLDHAAAADRKGCICYFETDEQCKEFMAAMTAVACAKPNPEFGDISPWINIEDI